MLGSLGAESLGKSAFDAPAVARIRPTRALIRPKARPASTAPSLDANVPRGEGSAGDASGRLQQMRAGSATNR